MNILHLQSKQLIIKELTHAFEEREALKKPAKPTAWAKLDVVTNERSKTDDR